MNKIFVELSDVILHAGRERFGAMMGIVSHVHEEAYDVVAASSVTGIPIVGDTYKLDAVYCREVIQKKHTVAIAEIDGVQGMCLHPLYDEIPFEFYISAPIVVSGEIWGTLNFTSLAKRDAPFTPDDIRFIEAQAQRLGEQLEMPG
ncbi:GAF domain-containing protein [Azospira oryzae]|uniref:GAF domain-containing protein n=1 Tax=Azospira oryzae TaxID=146939 RepID=UPI0005C13226|nr:GAF domain-containing protein [Azospira oryzae]